MSHSSKPSLLGPTVLGLGLCKPLPSFTAWLPDRLCQTGVLKVNQKVGGRRIPGSVTQQRFFTLQRHFLPVTELNPVSSFSSFHFIASPLKIPTVWHPLLKCLGPRFLNTCLSTQRHQHQLSNKPSSEVSVSFRRHFSKL